uniref:RNA-binding protein 26 n=1 Tax=Tetraselmis sp. GSL018 TaxID=582737 RepID=A0A061QRI7_9CHLO|mmetsp:Transcript_11081/g.26280  ORF Transcript_11081/g.26280 Transcript_11081/m.26280 type:complete len:749 (+) Transcript_11081:329-2575(+)
MSRRRRGSSSDFSSDFDSDDDDTNFKRRRRRSLSPVSAVKLQQPEAPAPLPPPERSRTGGVHSGGPAQALPVSSPDAHDRSRLRREIRYEGRAAPRGNGAMPESWRAPGMHQDRDVAGGGSSLASMAKASLQRGQRAAYFAQQQARQGDTYPGVEPYVPEYKGSASFGQGSNSGVRGSMGGLMDSNGAAAAHQMAGIFNDMPAPAVPLPLPFMPAPAIAAGFARWDQGGAGQGQRIPAVGRYEPATQGAPVGGMAPSTRGGWHGGNGAGFGHRGDIDGASMLPGKAAAYSDEQMYHAPYQPQHVSSRPGAGRGRGGQGAARGRSDEGRGRHMRERSASTICVLNLPTDNPDLRSALMKHFSKFGEVVGVRTREQDLPGKGHLAWVQMATSEQAEAALASPDAVLGNRFVRLEWATRDVMDFIPRNLGQSGDTGGKAGALALATCPGVAKAPPPPPPRSSAPEAAAPAETPSKVKELEKTAAQLSRKIEEQKKMLATLEARKKNAVASGEDGPPVRGHDPPGTRAQPMGLLPARGRGRWRGGRGSMPGRGAGAWTNKLDTRSTTVVRVVEVPAGVDFEALRAHFAAFGEVSRVEQDPLGGARVVFESKKEAEAALIGGKKIGEAQMILQWGTPFPASAAARPSRPSAAAAPSPASAPAAATAASGHGRGEASAPSDAAAAEPAPASEPQGCAEGSPAPEGAEPVGPGMEQADGGNRAQGADASSPCVQPAEQGSAQPSSNGEQHAGESS